MTARPRRTYRHRRSTAALGYQAPRQPISPGDVQALVLAHLRAYPHLDFTTGELARALHRSRTAVLTACQRLLDAGDARCTQQRPRRYQVTG
jgi:hypothetical protein